MNRRIRNRTYGGVGGRRGQPRLLPDPPVLLGEKAPAGRFREPSPGLGEGRVRHDRPGMPTTIIVRAISGLTSDQLSNPFKVMSILP